MSFKQVKLIIDYEPSSNVVRPPTPHKITRTIDRSLSVSVKSPVIPEDDEKTRLTRSMPDIYPANIKKNDSSTSLNQLKIDKYHLDRLLDIMKEYISLRLSLWYVHQIYYFPNDAVRHLEHILSSPQLIISFNKLFERFLKKKFDLICNVQLFNGFLFINHTSTTANPRH
jgi:hypothetical protein